MASMEELQMRIEVQDAVLGMAMNLMGQNNVPPHIIQDALVKAESRIAEYVTVEMVNSVMDEHVYAPEQSEQPMGAPMYEPPTVEGEVIE